MNVVGPGFDSRLKKVLFSVFGRFGFVCLIVVVFFNHNYMFLPIGWFQFIHIADPSHLREVFR